MGNHVHLRFAYVTQKLRFLIKLSNLTRSWRRDPQIDRKNHKAWNQDILLQHYGQAFTFERNVTWLIEFELCNNSRKTNRCWTKRSKYFFFLAHRVPATKYECHVSWGVCFRIIYWAFWTINDQRVVFQLFWDLHFCVIRNLYRTSREIWNNYDLSLLKSSFFWTWRGNFRWNEVIECE